MSNSRSALVGHINYRSEWWRTGATRPRFAQIPGTESQIVKGNGDMPVIVKVGWSLKKGLSAFFVCGLFHFLRAVNYQTICTSKRWDWTPLWKKNKSYTWIKMGTWLWLQREVFWCFVVFFLVSISAKWTQYILYMYTLTPIAFPVVTKKRLCWLQWPKFQFHKTKVPILKSICKNHRILKSVIDRYCQMCADPLKWNGKGEKSVS